MFPSEPDSSSSLVHSFSLSMEPEVSKDQILPHRPKKDSLQGFVPLTLLTFMCSNRPDFAKPNSQNGIKASLHKPQTGQELTSYYASS